MAVPRIRRLPFILIAGPLIALACSPSFLPAPPTLDRYPERLPVKTMRELLRETNPPPADAATFDQLAAETRAIAAELTVAPRAELLRRIDLALERNRAGDYRKRIANCLFDFRDLLAQEDVPGSAVISYAAWRVDAMEWDNGFFARPPAGDWQTTPEQVEEQHCEWYLNFSETAARLAAAEDKAAPPLKPHWLVQAGAWQFKHAAFDQAARLFQRVIAEAPQHPRAEVARLMIARCRIEEWRSAKKEAERDGQAIPRDHWQNFHAAQAALEDYLAAHPLGRFAPDIPGWRAGLAREIGALGEAISLFLQQTDFDDHPEIVRRALPELEACLHALDTTKLEEEIAQDGSHQLPLAEIARRPIAALAVVYHFLDAASRRDFSEMLLRSETLSDLAITDIELAPVLRMRRAGRVILPQLARAVADQKANYGGAVWRPKYLAILAWAASETGEHRQAVRVCDLAGAALETSDDLLFVRAVALQLAGDFDAAIAGFRHLQEKFPQSPLTAETPFRIATALRDRGESGAAVVELLRMDANRREGERQRWQQPEAEQPKPEVAPPLHPASEIVQWIDTLLQFAPLAELERGLASPDLDAEIAARLREILRMRHLAREDFAAAARFTAAPAALAREDELAESSAEAPLWVRRFGEHVGFPSELSGDAWNTSTEQLARLTRDAAATADPAVRAKRLFALAEAWSALRGRLTLPSTDDYGMCHSDFYEAWARRHQNARFAGHSAAAAAEELELRDELRHAVRYYVAAADAAPETELAARALWRANDAIRRMAELSPWSWARAFETNASAVSRGLHERLLRECPASPEAQRLSVWWSFAPPMETQWMPGDWQNYRMEAAITAVFADEPVDPWDSSLWPDLRPFDKRLAALAATAGTRDTSKLLEELAAIRPDFLPVFKSPNGARVINHLDDLTLFLQEPGLTPAARATYFAVRLSDEIPDAHDPELQPWRDYLVFLALVREAPTITDTGETHVRPMSERMREFLAAFPRSRKREAALARLAIAMVRESRVHTGVASSVWPDAPKLGGYKKIAVKRGRPFEVAPIFAALDAYDREFPNGRYAADLRLWRGAASIDAGDFATAVNLLVATLDDQSKRDLHLDAALNLADIFMRLIEAPEQRQEIVRAIAANASARLRLRQFMQSETLGARLRCLEDWLDQQFGVSGGN